jgi:hypothetical protein
MCQQNCSNFKLHQAAQGVHMNDKKQGADLKRRGFLLAGSAGAAGAVAAVVAPNVTVRAPIAAAKPVSADVGYQESDHVRTYYDLARV